MFYDIINFPPNKTSGIYAIVNKINWHIYIGSSENITNRWKRHYKLLQNGEHHSNHLQHAWNKYGADCFKFVIIFLCNKHNLLACEQFYIDILRPEYNVSPKAGSSMGIIRSEEYRLKQSISQRGKIISKETRERISHGMMGKQNSLGVKRSVSEETRAKISSSLVGHSVSEETRAKFRNKTFKHTEEAKRKIGDAAKGNKYASRKHSADEIAHHSEMMKEYWRNRKAYENGS